MGGIVMLVGLVAAYGATRFRFDDGIVFTPAGASLILAAVGFGVVGFIDDYLEGAPAAIPRALEDEKFIGTALVSVLFAMVVVAFTDQTGTSTSLSFVRPTALDLGVFFYIWVVRRSHVLFAFRQPHRRARRARGRIGDPGPGRVRLHLLLGVPTHVRSAGRGRVLRRRHARDAGCRDRRRRDDGRRRRVPLVERRPGADLHGRHRRARARRRCSAAFAITTNTQMLLIILGGLYVIETMSVIVQVISFRGFGRRVFRMSPIHHHFELSGWPEFTVIVRFWIIAGLCVAVGLGVFYADFIARGGLG